MRVKTKGSFKNTERFLNWGKKKDIRKDLEDIGRIGARALATTTPKDTGRTAASWDYEIVKTPNGWRVDWVNHNINDGAVVALLIQYGHATGYGGYVPPTDYINPVMVPLFGDATEDFWDEVTNA